jgi:hypothetical protein
MVGSPEYGSSLLRLAPDRSAWDMGIGGVGVGVGVAGADGYGMDIRSASGLGGIDLQR